MIWEVAAVVVALGLGGLTTWITSLSKEFDKRKSEAMLAVSREDAAAAVGKVLSEADIAHLPPPVRRYMALTGCLGRPIVSEIMLWFDARMYERGDTTGMAGPVRQYDCFDSHRPRRLFLMTTWMKRFLPLAVLHDFALDDEKKGGGGATMQVRLAGLLDVVNLAGPELTRTETVTFLNDIAFFAPSRLVDPRLAWTAVKEDDRARVALTMGPNTVSAELIFDRETGELVDFVSEDRGMLEKNGSLRILRWTTPLSNYRDFDGWRLATEGCAIWHLPEGPYTYGRMRLTRYEAK
jgi:hypothetical protein